MMSTIAPHIAACMRKAISPKFNSYVDPVQCDGNALKAMRDAKKMQHIEGLPEYLRSRQRPTTWSAGE